ncbi:tetratricopeptide repeat protein [Candidatus Latescibacterota bacterium]
MALRFSIVGFNVPETGINGKFSKIFVVCVFLLTALTASAQEPVVVNTESGAEYNKGLELYNKRNYTEAITFFEKAYQLDDKNIAAVFAHGLALNGLKKYREAAEKFRFVLEKEPGHQKALIAYPAALYMSGQEVKALAAYDKGIKLLPEEDALYYGRSFIYYKQKKYKDAVDGLVRAVELKSRELKYQFLLAQTYQDMGRMEDAYTTAMKILNINKNHARARIIAADYKRISGKLEDALKEYELAAKNIETKAYAEYFIEVIKQQLEEIEIEKEWEARQNSRQ